MNSTESDRPTTSERYGVAVGNGSTIVSARGSSGDVVLAAAMARNRFGVSLLRLQAEFDQVRGNLSALTGAKRQREAASISLLAIAKDMDRHAAEHQEKAMEAQTDEVYAAHRAEVTRLQRRAARARADAEEVLKRTPGEIISERHMILSSMQTLRSTAIVVGARAIVLATRRKYMRPDADVQKTAGKVLDVWLDPRCHHCDGTGKKGSEYLGEKPTTCKPCKGTGERRDSIGRDTAERWFAGELLADLQQSAAAGAAGISNALHGEPSTKNDSTSAQAEVARSVADLRGEQASTD